MITCDNFTVLYYKLIQKVYEEYDYECSPRGMKIREVIGAEFELTNPMNRLPYIPERNFSISYYCGELLWYLAKRKDVKWIAKYSPFWLDVTDDGETANSSYGARVFSVHPSIANGTQVQWNRIVEELERDPDSRRAVVYFGQPADHTDYKLDVGCTTASQFFIREGKLHQIVTMRSNDLILGTPYDVTWFTVLQELLAERLEVGLGTYIHRSNSLHIYERNFPLAESILKEMDEVKDSDYPPCPPFPEGYDRESVGRIMRFEENLWRVKTHENVRGLLNHFFMREEEQFWRDWACILAMHRAKKLTDDKKANRELRKECLSRIKFEGYKRFRK